MTIDAANGRALVNAIDLLEQQHHHVASLADEFGDASSERQAEIAREVVFDLRLHTTIEEEIFYPAVRERVPSLEDEILEDLEEHHAVEMLLDEMDGMDPTDERFEAKFTVIRELVEHHVQEEREDLFPEVQDQLDQALLEELGLRMAQRYEELRVLGGMEPTKEELYERARKLDIDGRSSMSKRQLANAIRATV